MLTANHTPRTPSGPQASRTAVVTGAARGVGFAIAQRLARANFTLVLADIDKTVLDIASLLPSAVGMVTDLAEEGSASAIVAEATKAWGSLDVLINNAASPGPSDNVATLSRRALHRLFEVNVYGVTDLCREATPHLVKSSGVIVNVSSLFADYPVSNGVAYSMSKSAVKNLTQVLALELGPAGVRVNAVAPGYILTDMHRLEVRSQAESRGITEEQRLRELREEVPLGRHGTPADVADVVGWLVSDDSRYIHGQTIAINGGLTFS